MHRRQFLMSGVSLTAGAAAAQLEGISALIQATASIGTRQQALIGLLTQRDLLMFSDENANLFGLWMDHHEALGALKVKHLSSVGGDASLLAPNEAYAFKQDLCALQDKFRAATAPITEKVRVIDDALGRYPDALGKIAQTPPPALSELNPATLHDARALAAGNDAPALATEVQRLQKVTGEFDALQADITKVMQTPPSDEWKQKRGKALQSSMGRTLSALLEIEGVSIESSLTRSYGPDNWTIRSRMKQAEIGSAHDKRITKLLNDLEQDLRKAYPQRFMNREAPLVARSRPLQSGYGEHDCECMAIQGPDFALREVLKQAHASYLAHYNEKNTLRMGLAR